VTTQEANAATLRAIVTGATSGIGRAIAAAVAAGGGSVCLIGRSRERLEVVAQQARATGDTVIACQCDLADDTARLDLLARIENEFPDPNVLVHSAGEYASGTLEATPVEVLDTLYRANVRAPYALTRALLPVLVRTQGQIVFVNSSQGLRAGNGVGAFAATQHAQKAIADSLRQEVNSEKIRVLTVYPGRTATPRIEALYKSDGSGYRPDLLLQPEDVAQVVLNALCMPRTAEIMNVEVRPLAKSY
jgi:NADP-dependent 3-hydroxy acid dehydrogenase YdfG